MSAFSWSDGLSLWWQLNKNLFVNTVLVLYSLRKCESGSMNGADCASGRLFLSNECSSPSHVPSHLLVKGCCKMAAVVRWVHFLWAWFPYSLCVVICTLSFILAGSSLFTVPLLSFVQWHRMGQKIGGWFSEHGFFFYLFSPKITRYFVQGDSI